MEEKWLPVVGYEDSYEVSDLGRVRSRDRMFWNKGTKAWVPVKGRLLKPGRQKLTGHLYVALSKNNTMKTYRIHVLVLTAFVGPRPAKGIDGRHFPDRDPGNNKLTNLNWSTHAENMADMITHGTHTAGERNKHAKLTAEQVSEIRQLYQSGFGHGDLAKIFGVTKPSISRICARTIWKNVA